MNQKKYFVLILAVFAGIFLFGYAFGACSGSSPKWRSSADYNSVRSCVLKAKMGDTIIISGDAVWTKTLTLNKGLTLIGSGNPVITSALAVFYWKPDPAAQAAGDKLMIKGFVFDGNGSNFRGLGPIKVSDSSEENYANLIDKNNTVRNTCADKDAPRLAALLYTLAASKTK
jgi:hypothetical protein